ncbi:MAG: hypothetical protein LBB38_03475 [Puniceicoccales bacterium]|nr:hypothetical protein [Puniceicoccales bacterium]
MLRGLSASTLANAYWMLRSISVSYSYEISAYGPISNSYSITCDDIPPSRLIQTPTFAWSGYNSQLGLAAGFSLNLSTPLAEESETYALNLHIYEGTYPYMELLLSTELLASHDILASSSFEFLGKTVPIYLQADQSLSITGSIAAVSLTAEFFEVEPQ